MVKLAPIPIFDSVFKGQRENVSLTPRTVVPGGVRTRHQALAVGHFLRGRYEEAANAARRAAELQRVKISPPRNRVVSKGRRHRSRKSHADRMVLSCT